MIEDLLARDIINYLDVPADELAHEILEVCKVLRILMDQVPIANLPLLVLIHARLMLVNLCLQIVSHHKGVVLLNAELRDVNRCAWVDLLLKLLQVVAGKVKVGSQARLLDQIGELCN